MRIGMDFDNTIACYDRAFYAASLEQKILRKNTSYQSKYEIRNYLRKENKENIWTKLQGYVYGNRMDLAYLFPGFLEFFAFTKKRNFSLFIISHRTKYPYLGPRYDLHQAAKKWIDHHLLFPKKDLFLELTLFDKLQKIEKLRCDYFIDDLQEVLLEKKFPKKVKKILFDPNNSYQKNSSCSIFSSWKEILQFFQNAFK